MKQNSIYNNSPQTPIKYLGINIVKGMQGFYHKNSKKLLRDSKNGQKTRANTLLKKICK